MEVKTALIRFGACFIVGIVGFYFVVPLLIQNIGFDWGYFAFPTILILVGFFGFFGTLIYWLFRRVQKWIADGVSY